MRNALLRNGTRMRFARFLRGEIRVLLLYLYSTESTCSFYEFVTRIFLLLLARKRHSSLIAGTNRQSEGCESARARRICFPARRIDVLVLQMRDETYESINTVMTKNKYR